MNIKRSYIIVGIILALALIGVLLLFSRGRTGVLALTATKDTPENANVSANIIRDGEDEQTVTLKPGETVELRLPVGRVRVDGRAGDLRSVDIVDIKSFSTAKLTTPTGEKRAVQQLAANARNCPVIVRDVTFSYGCEGEDRIVRHDSNKLGNSLNTVLFDGVSFSSLKPYKEGLLGFYATAGSSATNFLYVNLATQNVEIVRLPDNIQQLLVNQPQVITAQETSNTRFALLFTQENKLFAFDDVTDTTPTSIKAGKDIKFNDTGRRITASFSNETLVLTAGNSTDTGEGDIPEAGEAATEIPQPLDAYLFEYDKSGKLTKTITIPDDVEANGIYKLDGDFYAADQPYGFGFFRAEDGELNHVYTFEDMSSWTVANNKAYVVSAGTLYEFKPGENGLFSLHGLFSSSRLIVSALYTTPKGIVFTGLQDDSKDAPLNIYQVLGKGQKATSDPSNTEGSQTEPFYTGLEDFLYYGASSFQTDNLRFALGNYAGSSTTPITSIELFEVTPAPYDRFSDSSITTITFKARLNNDTTLSGKLEIHDLSTIRVILSNADGSTAFDSGIISHKDSPSYNPEPAH